jgi:hypothetical protein
VLATSSCTHVSPARGGLGVPPSYRLRRRGLGHGAERRRLRRVAATVPVELLRGSEPPAEVRTGVPTPHLGVCASTCAGALAPTALPPPPPPPPPLSSRKL